MQVAKSLYHSKLRQLVQYIAVGISILQPKIYRAFVEETAYGKGERKVTVICGILE